MKLVTPEQMREMDRRTIEEVGIPGAVLMERAALGAVETLLERSETRPDRVGILCGGGNNGGDGIAMARMLEHRNISTLLAFLSSPDAIEGDAGGNLAIARNLDLERRNFSELDPEGVARELEKLPRCDIWVDALLGTGLTGEVRGRYVPAIEFLNERRRVFAVDIPSGIHGGDGREMGVAVDADVTATFGETKLGQALYPGRARCGALHTIDIGIPEGVCEQVGTAAEWLDEPWARGRLAARPSVYHKGRSGRVLALAGSHEKTGAALLTARGALAGGAGLITVGTTPDVVPRIASTVNEVMAAELVATDADETTANRLDDFIEDVDTVAAGPGLERHDGAVDAVRTLLRSDVESAVLDADALNIVASEFDDSILERFANDALAVLTPHPGEMSRLCGCDIDRVVEAPVECASNYARDTGAIVVLKMAATVVASPQGRIAVNRSGNPGMATGGMGDVLTGIVAARLTESTGDPFDDVALAVWAHGHAGDRVAEARGERGLRASEIPDELPAIWSEIESG